jgi:integrase/recombinase XerC
MSAARISRDRFLSDPELAAFMAAVRDRRHVNQPRDHALFALLANTGMRPSEALALRRRDVHVHARPPWIQIRRLKKRNPGRVDELQITDALAAVVNTLLEEVASDDCLFTITRRQAERLFHYYCRGIIKGRCLYALRHTAATRIYRATRDIKIVQAVLGHESADTSALYAHIPRSIMLEMTEQLPVVV